MSIQSLRARREEEAGFTLIELMVVVLIIAILIAIAIPTFLGAQDRARDRGAQSDLRNALTAAKTVATDHSGYFQKDDGTALDKDTMLATEPSLKFDAIGSATDSVIGVAVGSDTTTTPATPGLNVTFEKRSASGTWFGIGANSRGTVLYCKSSTATAQADCNGYTNAKFVEKW
ncbi:MAG: prepilin-type N-terminal cleavage/methylation domain-containing protein [Acidobacteria bacterium]|nr:prepilin-type N-terminal cleavage/methylation domain-containing protein [Acidobacteriota bacterium]